MKKNYKLELSSLRSQLIGIMEYMTAFNKKFLRGGLNQWVSGPVGQRISSMIGKRSYESLIMMPRPHPEMNENQHKRFAQHIGSPRRGAPGRRRKSTGGKNARGY
ncbi:MAG: hypothetical protein PVH61_42455 [Candidatus Aminicenantes bacterium]|jgi:hypothetical protein